LTILPPENHSSVDLHGSTPIECTDNLSDSLLNHLAINNCCSVTNKQANFPTWYILPNWHKISFRSSSEIFPQHYYAFRKEHSIHGGGVFILVDKSISGIDSRILTHCREIPI